MKKAMLDNLFGFRTKFYYNDNGSKKELIAQPKVWGGSLKAGLDINGTIYEYKLEGYEPIVIKGYRGKKRITLDTDYERKIKDIIKNIKDIKNVIKIKYLGHHLEKNEAKYDFRSKSRTEQNNILYYFYAMPLYDGNLTDLLYDETLDNEAKTKLIDEVKKIIVNAIENLMNKKIIPDDITFDNILYKKNSDSTYEFCLIDIDLWRINEKSKLISNYETIIEKRIDYIFNKIITGTTKDKLYNTIHTNPPTQIEGFNLNYHWTLEDGIINYSPNTTDTTNTLPIEASIALDNSPSAV